MEARSMVQRGLGGGAAPAAEPRAGAERTGADTDRSEANRAINEAPQLAEANRRSLAVS